ncbi:MAG TPA: sodium-dependent transporter [Gammaproteobacteria bacterium]|nr:sodium-dependent transporter [Gammaproteobacteria bacterium]
MTQRTSLHGFWSSRMAFVLAVSGSAIGLGNIWKFPYITGQNGGGAFVIVYLLCVFLIGLPIMISEILIGRRGRRNPITTMALLGEEEGGQRQWQLVGVMGVLAGFIILSFYSVIAGWTIGYIFHAASGAFTAADPSRVGGLFADTTGVWWKSAALHSLFMFMTVVVVARGVERGLEQAVRVLMPSLFVLLIVMLAYSAMSGHFQRGFEYMFDADFSKLTPYSVLAALGHSFFTLSVGICAVMAYGAYLPQRTSIVSASIAVVIADTLVSLLAGLVIFPIVFANGLAPDDGPGLIFLTLPLAFGNMPAGAFFGALFFVLLSFAAWTSAIGLIEPAVAWAVERRGLTRARAATIVGVIVWALGFSTVLSFNVLADVRFLRGSIFANIDFLASNILLPLGGLFITLFAGWIICRNASADELNVGTGLRYLVWRFLTRYVAPVGVVLIFLHAVGFFAP